MSVVRMSHFGKMGRFGNQLFQSAFVQTYARRRKIRAELMPWVGDDLFEHATPRMAPGAPELPVYREEGGVIDYPTPPRDGEVDGKDFIGYAQYHTGYYTYAERDFIRSLFVPTPKVAVRFGGALADYFDNGTVVGLHFRRADYGQLIYYITPAEWYLKKLRELWPTLEDPRLFIASEDPAIVDEFKEYKPETTTSLGIELGGDLHKGYNYLELDKSERTPLQVDFFPDWYLLSKCNVLLIPNSTFSFSAAMMSATMSRHDCYRSSLHTHGFEPINPWNANPLTFDYVDDFPEVEGIAMETNPYWTNQPGGRRLLKPEGAAPRKK